MATVNNLPLFKAVYFATLDVVQNHSDAVPTHLLTSDQPLLRVVDVEPYYRNLKNANTAKLTQAYADSARTIFNEKHTDKRWSGTGLNVARDQGALYASLSSGSLSAEMAHYNKWLPSNGSGRAPEIVKAFSPRATSHQKALFRLRPTKGLLVVDLSKHSTYREPFFDLIDRDPAVSRELRVAGIAGLSEGCKTATDYSCARGVALGLATATSPAYDGILVQTARDNAAILDDGDNVALFGPNGAPHPKLTVECVVAPVALDPNRIELRYIGY